MRALTVKQMKVLKEKGLDYSKAASLCWVNISYIDEYGDKVIIRKNALIDFDEDGEIYPDEIDVIQPTLMLEDILKLLPETIKKKPRNYNLTLDHTNKSWYVYYYYPEGVEALDDNFIDSEDLLQAAYEMLLWCLDNKYI